jgi:protoporphyrinogen IX oxidase
MFAGKALFYVKTLHILMVISWMAGIFYLPRIFVHFVEGSAAGEDVRRLKVMAKKLYHFASAMGVLAIGSGLWLWLAFGFAGGWIHAKISLVVLMVGYHISMRVFMKRMLRDAPLPSSTTLRWYNELPLLLLIGIVWLVVVKPF